MADKKPAGKAVSEEELALEELMGRQDSVGGRTKGEASPRDRGQADEALLALEELIAAEKNPDQEKVHDEVPKKGKAEGGSTSEELDALVAYDPGLESAAVPEEDRAIEELVAAQGPEDSPETVKDARPGAKGKDGIIRLKEVVALGGLSADGTDADEDSALEQLMAAGASPEKTTVSEQKVRPQANRSPQKPPGSPQSAPGLHGGLSEDEKDDLERLIKGLKDEQSPGVSVAVLEGLQKQAQALQNRVVQLTKIVKKYDNRMKTYAEVLRLYNEKTELMNRRMDKIEDLIKGK
jgi:hypothetical protein